MCVCVKMPITVTTLLENAKEFLTDFWFFQQIWSGTEFWLSLGSDLSGKNNERWLLCCRVEHLELPRI